MLDGIAAVARKKFMSGERGDDKVSGVTVDVYYQSYPACRALTA